MAENNIKTFTQEEVNKIVSERLQREREKIDTLTTNEDYKAKYEQLQAENSERELISKIESVFPKDKKFTSDYVRKGIIADIKEKYLVDNTLDMKVCFDELTNDKEGIFQSVHPASPMGGFENISPLVEHDKLESIFTPSIRKE